MPDIDVSKIKPGDTVKVRYQDTAMKDLGIVPVEIEGVAYNDGTWGLYVGPVPLNNHHDATVLEHIPAGPGWADALVVRAADGFLWGRRANDYWHGPLPHSNARRTAELGARNGPITVVIDADGNPPRPEVDPYAADFAWSQYRKEYAPNPGDMATAHKAFHAGWEAALHA